VVHFGSVAQEQELLSIKIQSLFRQEIAQFRWFITNLKFSR